MRASLVLFAPQLSPLPVGYETFNPDQRAKALLHLKNNDTQQYQLLRSQALRCAR